MTIFITDITLSMSILHHPTYANLIHEQKKQEENYKTFQNVDNFRKYNMINFLDHQR